MQRRLQGTAEGGRRGGIAETACIRGDVPDQTNPCSSQTKNHRDKGVSQGRYGLAKEKIVTFIAIKRREWLPLENPQGTRGRHAWRKCRQETHMTPPVGREYGFAPRRGGLGKGGGTVSLASQ